MILPIFAASFSAAARPGKWTTMKRVLQFIQDWMLPLAIVTGITMYLAMRFLPGLGSVEPGFSKFSKNIQPTLVALMLFLQFNKVSPHDLRVHRWHFRLLLVQAVLFAVFALIASRMPHGVPRILVESATLCFITPTAAAAGVITSKLGGNLATSVTYLVLANCLAAVLIPLLIPLLNPTEGMSFGQNFFGICRQVFPLLILPLAAAWIIRYTMHKVQVFLMHYTHWAFYLWGLSLTFALYLATRALVNSGISTMAALLIAGVALLCTLFQFFVGRKAGKPYGHAESITSGQVLGQKNTGFLIWLGYSFMTPVTSVAGGLYSIFQNLVNSWELYERRVSGQAREKKER